MPTGTEGPTVLTLPSIEEISDTYNIGKPVYYIHDGKITPAKITGILLTLKKNSSGQYVNFIKYTLDERMDCTWSIDRDRVFESENDLITHLQT
jgi:hypothetical protein